MCRWFAYVSPTEHCLLEDVLITPDHGLAKQVNENFLPRLLSHDPRAFNDEAEIARRNKFLNVDGFGLAWYTAAGHFFSGLEGKRPTVYKNSQPPTNDANFHSICANTATTACFAHIRSATATAVTPINNHPFVFGRHTMMHNGVITDFLEIKRDMLGAVEKSAYENILGSTDSEHLAGLYMTCLTKNSSTPGRQSWEQTYPVAEMKQALFAAIQIVVGLQQKALGDIAQANSLNVAVTDGSQLVAFRYRNHAIEQPPSLYWSTTEGATLNRKYPDHADGKENPQACKQTKEHGKHIIVASEPSTYHSDRWSLIPKNHCVLIEKNGNVHVEAIETPEIMMAKGKTTVHG